jgi:dienelactone hydrolase
MRTLLLCLATLHVASMSVAVGADFPDVSQLKPISELPDPLAMFDGRKVTSAEQWNKERRPELKALFQHYMYGFLPPAPENVSATIDLEDNNYFGGKATLKLVTIKFGPKDAPPIQLLLMVPNKRTGPAPAFFGLNFCGNHTALDDSRIPLPQVWMPERCPGCKGNVASETGRGAQKDVWSLEKVIDRGYAVATAYNGDIDPDKPDFTDGVHPHYLKAGQTSPGPHDWGTIAAWAWGLHRIVDYLVTDRDIDKTRLAVVGHSRLGKTALLAGAFDERIALVIPHQAGTGGSSPSRKTGKALTKAESVTRINTSFPHWFNDEFTKFNDRTELLPFDQHCLAALCAPRPVLLTNAEDDAWADPEGQFQMLHAAEPVYRLLGAGGLEATEFPGFDKLISSRLGFFIRQGKHSMTPADWDIFLEFADRHFAMH